jgi:serine/threonine-protein kinase
LSDQPGARPGILDRGSGGFARLLLGDPIAGVGAGAVVGRYRLQSPIGEGGMSTVWSACHVDPNLPQRVAIKLLHPLLATPDWRERFLREQRILARLGHPRIVRLFDAGLTDTGMPYLVMDLVEGVAIDRHADAARLDLLARVRLFLKVCDAVAFAHRNLIVHRDLKPANVLVDAHGEPVLLDFGIAKPLSDADGELTGTGHALMTPAYAAPEQRNNGPITTATDVFGLGALLHLLLTGARVEHYPDGRLRRPSTRVDEATAHARSMSLRQLRDQLFGDLDAILERALRREPEARYASVTEFAAELQRWLRGDAVLARAGNWRYRIGKRLRRHWLVASLIVVTGVGLGTAALVSTRASHRAEAAAARASTEAARAKESRDFVLALMRDLRPGSTTRTPSRLLDRAAQRLHAGFARDDVTRIELLLVLGELERGYGRLNQSRALFEEAAAAAHAHAGSASPRWLEAEANLGHTMFRLSDYRSGHDRLEQALRDYDAANGPRGGARILAQIRLAQLLGPLGKPDAALRLFESADLQADASLHRLDPLRLNVKELYGEALANDGRIDRARQVLKENLALVRERFGDADLAVVSALESLALREIEDGEPARALPLLLDAERISAGLLDGPHVFVGYVQNSLGTTRLRLGQGEAAQAAFARALANYEQLYAPPHRMLVATHENLGEAAFERGDYAAAAEAFLQAADMQFVLEASAPAQGLNARCLAAEALVHAGQFGAARAQLDGCASALHRSLEPEPADQAITLTLEAELSLRLGQRDGARTAAMASRARHQPKEPHLALRPLLVLAELDAEAGRSATLQAHLQSAREIVKAKVWARPCQTVRQLARLTNLARRSGVTSVEPIEPVEAQSSGRCSAA